jgi:hypothetical protein
MFSGNLFDFLLWSLWFFIWISALGIYIQVIFDMFRDSSLSGWAKAGWAFLLIVLPWLGALIYLIARGNSMNERRMAALAEVRDSQQRYIQQVAATANPAEQIASAKKLLDSGAITQAEYDTLKAKALA